MVSTLRSVTRTDAGRPCTAAEIPLALNLEHQQKRWQGTPRPIVGRKRAASERYNENESEWNETANRTERNGNKRYGTKRNRHKRYGTTRGGTK